MIDFIKASAGDVELLMLSRLEMLRAVNELPPDYIFSDELMKQKKKELRRLV